MPEANPVLETIAEIAKAERTAAIEDGDYTRAVVAALVEGWARAARGGGASG